MTRHERATWLVGLLAATLLLATSVGSVVPPEAGPDRSLDDGTLGVVDGVRYDDDVAVTGEDGLNASERAVMTARSMARIERLRGLDFDQRVNVTVISRAEYRANYSAPFESSHDAWNNQVWEGLFLVGEDRSVSEVFNDTFRSSVLGYYEPGTGNIVLVSDSETPQLARRTLVHELVHALQDQRFGLDERPETQDRQLARNAVVEGEAERVASLYEQRCRDQWECVDVAPPSSGGSTSPSKYQNRVFQVIYHPYAAGPAFVTAVAERGGTDALDSLYETYPPSTEQIIHPAAYPDERPVNVSVPDRSNSEWQRFDHDPVADTVGEASIFVMADVHGLGEQRGTRFEYRNTVSMGWGGDTLVPYWRGDGSASGVSGSNASDGEVPRDAEFGYVWETTWDSTADAREFHEAYQQLLSQHDAERLEAGVYQLPADSDFSGTYRVTREGQTVMIVHGPDESALAAIHAP